jgi:hypothetical protein
MLLMLVREEREIVFKARRLERESGLIKQETPPKNGK